MRRITLLVSDDLHLSLKKLAFIENRTISSVTREALYTFCKEKKSTDIEILDHRGNESDEESA